MHEESWSIGCCYVFYINHSVQHALLCGPPGQAGAASHHGLKNRQPDTGEIFRIPPLCSRQAVSPRLHRPVKRSQYRGSHGLRPLGNCMPEPWSMEDRVPCVIQDICS